MTVFLVLSLFINVFLFVCVLSHKDEIKKINDRYKNCKYEIFDYQQDLSRALESNSQYNLELSKLREYLIDGKHGEWAFHDDGRATFRLLQ